jgi:hypothetical protein
VKSFTVRSFANLTVLHTDKLDPRCAKELTDKELPRVPGHCTLNVSPNLTKFLTERLLPSIN